VKRPSYLDRSLLDPRFDFDSCGVGFVAHLSAEPSHTILRHALTALTRLAHRERLLPRANRAMAWA
jgi:hypothetical protein